MQILPIFACNLNSYTRQSKATFKSRLRKWSSGFYHRDFSITYHLCICKLRLGVTSQLMGVDTYWLQKRMIRWLGLSLHLRNCWSFRKTTLVKYLWKHQNVRHTFSIFHHIRVQGYKSTLVSYYVYCVKFCICCAFRLSMQYNTFLFSNLFWCHMKGTEEENAKL